MNRTLEQVLAIVVPQTVRFHSVCLQDSSTSKTPFSLVYRRDARVPTSLDFNHLESLLPGLETEYAKELFVECLTVSKTEH